MSRFFSGLRGKLILTYTLVTVLALMALEILALAAVLGLNIIYRTNVRSYLGDVITTLYPQARNYLQPSAQDLEGLQAWLDQTTHTGLASLPAQDFFDSPAAAIVDGEPLLVLAEDYTVLAQSPRGSNDMVGRKYTPPDDPVFQNVLDSAFGGTFDAIAVSYENPDGTFRMAVPVFQTSYGSPVVGVILLSVEPVPPAVQSSAWPFVLMIVLVTGVVLLIAVAPFGALFGLVMSGGLTRRLSALARAADAWSEGDFGIMPVDRSNDEIGVLGRRLQTMAERIQNLLQSQHELAVLEERHRLARDLHDTVKQQSFATLMQVRAARNLLDANPEASKEHLTTAEGLLKSSQQELGLLISELRPAALEGHGLVGALRSYLATWSEHTRIPTQIQASNERRLPLAVEQTLYRVTQEALANIARHSRASAVQVQISFSEQSVRLVITDNGVGFTSEQATTGYGLKSMRERMLEIDGQLEITSLPNQGTRVTAYAPTNA